MILEDTPTPLVWISSISNNNMTDNRTRKAGEVLAQLA